MFDKVNIPVLGFVENMSGFICPNCKHETTFLQGRRGAGPASWVPSSPGAHQHRHPRRQR